MADRMKDAEDRKLDALFASDAIPDKGFSVRIEKRIRRQFWVRRLTLPIAVLIGGSIAAKPLAGLLGAVLKLLSVVPGDIAQNLGGTTVSSLPQFSTLIFGGIIVLIFVMATRVLEE